MADATRSISDLKKFQILQDKLRAWLDNNQVLLNDDYHGRPDDGAGSAIAPPWETCQVMKKVKVPLKSNP